MANSQAMATSFKQDLLNGKHAFGASVVRASTAADSFKVALYLTSASNGAATAAYTSTGEVSGTGYTAGGVAVTAFAAPAVFGTTAYTTPGGSFTFSGVTLSSAFDCAVLYNNTAAGKNAVAVFTFGSQTVTAGTLLLDMPTNDSTNALIRIA
jgi:hypothetical protein